MNEIAINDRISYIEASDDPLSADIGIIRTDRGVWLYDVGNGEQNIACLNGNYHIVLSHFHADHTGNIDRIRAESVYVSGETYRHVHRGTVVRGDVYTDGLHIFPLPSSHTKGCLGLEADETYAFVGDALYCRVRDGFYIYNPQLLKDEITVLGRLKSSRLLVSHFRGLVRDKGEVIEELEMIYSQREKNSPEIRIRIGEEESSVFKG